MVTTPEFFTRDHEIRDGWRLPLSGNLISYLYVRRLDFAFEVWLGGDWDVTVRLQRPFSFGFGDLLPVYEPRTTRKSELGPLLDIGNFEVAEFLVQKTGDLRISFSNGYRLVAVPADDGAAWRLEWPFEGDVRVAAHPGGGLDWSSGDHLSRESASDGSGTAIGLLKPRRRGSMLELPIRGLITESSGCGSSIELVIPISGEDQFCVHFGGELHITDASGAVWHGQGDAEDRSTLARVLDLLGTEVVAARSDANEVLHLAFTDAAEMTAERGKWEAHWPTSPGSPDEHWVPSEGPNIP